MSKFGKVLDTGMTVISTQITNWKYFTEIAGSLERAKSAGWNLNSDVGLNGAEEKKIISYDLGFFFFFDLVKIEKGIAYYEFTGTGG